MLVGQGGAAAWPGFLRWRKKQPPSLADPLDTWSRLVIGEIARKVGARAVSPSDRPHLPFQQWAKRAEGLKASPLGIATTGAEYFCEFGLRIKKASRHPWTWVVSLANDYIGYVPTPQAFVGGGYEPRTARSSKLAPDAGQKILEGSLKALNRVMPKAEEKKDEKK